MGLLGLLLAVAAAAEKAPADPREPERLAMVAEQIEARGVSDARVLAAMRAVPRHRFVPPSYQAQAYSDRPLPIGLGQTISQPYIVAAMTEALRLKKGDKVLEVGTGSGYQAAVLAQLTGRVYSIEILKELSERAAAALQEAGARVKLRVGDGYLGWPEAAPFDAIVVTAAASHVPPPLFKQLAEGGRMVIPVGSAFQAQDLVLITKVKGRLRSRSLMPVAFVPLVREPP